MMVQGTTSGIGRYDLERLEQFADERWPKYELMPQEKAYFLQEISNKIKREIVVYLNRNGYVEAIEVGHQNSAPAQFISTRRSKNGYLGVRMIHTHPQASAYFSEADLSALEKYHYDSIMAIGSEKENFLSLAYLTPEEDNFQIVKHECLTLDEMNALPYFETLLAEERKLDRQSLQETESVQEKVILVFQPEQQDAYFEQKVSELRELAKTAGLEIVGEMVQKQRGKKGTLGQGKREELFLMVQALGADCAIFEKTLTPAEQSMLAENIHCKVLDKTALILDIFAQRAKSREGKLQVELAQLEYLLPRLTGQGLALSRLGGGVGTRGPGETQLETDRRHIRRRIDKIKEQLREVEKHRLVQQKSRQKKDIFHFALVGYTNAGKSSLLNCLTEEDIYVADQLFATLDSTTRQLPFLTHPIGVISDTVGFIRELPPQLVNAFKSTLEQLQEADVILHVVDISQEGYEERIRVVNEMIDNLDLNDKEQIYVYNKIDAISEKPYIGQQIPSRDVIYISTKTREGIPELIERMKALSQIQEKHYRFSISYQDEPTKHLSQAYQLGKVSEVDYSEAGLTFNLETGKSLPENLKLFISEEEESVE